MRDRQVLYLIHLVWPGHISLISMGLGDTADLTEGNSLSFRWLSEGIDYNVAFYESYFKWCFQGHGKTYGYLENGMQIFLM